MVEPSLATSAPGPSGSSPAMLIDSDVLVWLTRGHVGAAQRLQVIEHWRISS